MFQNGCVNKVEHNVFYEGSAEIRLPLLMITNLVVPTKTNSFGSLILNCWKKIGDKFGVDAAEAEKKYMNTRTGTMSEISSEPKVCAFDVLSFQCQVFH